MSRAIDHQHYSREVDTAYLAFVNKSPKLANEAKRLREQADPLSGGAPR